MSTIQERQKVRAAKKVERKAAALPKQNTRKFIYRIFKNYTPKKNRGRFHRATNNEKSKNVIWDLAGNPGDKQFKNLAEARYTFLNSKNIQTLTDSEVEEYNTLKLLLEKYNKNRNELNTLKRLVLTEEGIGQYNSTHDPLPFMPPRPSGLDPKPARAAAAAAAKASANASAAALPASGIARKAPPPRRPAVAALPASGIARKDPPPFGSAAAARTAAAAAAASAPAAAPASVAAAAPASAAAASPSAAPAPAAASAPASSAAAAPSNSGNPTPPVPGAAPSNSTAGDPQSIDDTIKKMRCTVCQSQKIISGALGTTPRSCNNCGAAAAPAAAAATPAVASSAAAAAASNPYSGLIQVVVQNDSTEEDVTDPRNHHTENSTGAKAPRLLGNKTESFAGGRRSRRRHRKTSRRTKNKRSTRRR